MKKVIAGVFVWVLVTVGLSAADQMVSQVTYFPLSYTGYHNLQVDNLEVGIGRVQSSNNLLGKTDLATYPLQVDTQTTVNNGVLSLSQVYYISVTGSSLTFGDSSGKESSIMFGDSVRLGGNAKFKNLNADVLKVGKLKLGNEVHHTFPNCTAAEDSQHNNMYWVPLKLKTNQGDAEQCKWYLTCGKPVNLAAETMCVNLINSNSKKKCRDWLNDHQMTCTYGPNQANANKLVDSIEFIGYCCLAPVYQYELANQATVGHPSQCQAPCVISGSYNENGGMFPPSNGNPLAGNFFTPNCNSSNLNHECIVQQKSGGLYYCHEYRCRAAAPPVM